MKGLRVILCSVAVAALTVAFALTASAVAVETETVTLYEVKDTFDFSKYLPAFFGATLVIESVLIMLISKVRRIVTVSFASLIANAVSFVSLRVMLGLKHQQTFYTGMLTHGPSWTSVGLTALYFVITVAIELPIIWFSTREFAGKKGRLMAAVIIANMVTSVAVTLVELQLNYLHG